MATDYKRWSNLDNFHKAWTRRTSLMATLIPSDVETLLEFGAGTRFLETVLPHDIEYFPSDIVSRGEDTIVCDLNVRPYAVAERKFDCVFFSGVLEYVNDLDLFIQYLPELTNKYVICSYTDRQVNHAPNGWALIYPPVDFVKLFTDAGFVLELSQQSTHKSQTVYRFKL